MERERERERERENNLLSLQGLSSHCVALTIFPKGQTLLSSELEVKVSRSEFGGDMQNSIHSKRQAAVAIYTKLEEYNTELS
jgi:hypothetical protein